MLKRPKPKAAPAAGSVAQPASKPSAQPAVAPASKPKAKASAQRGDKPWAKPRLQTTDKPIFRRDRKPSVRRFPKLALHRHPTSVSYGPDEWRMVVDALPLIQQWVREQSAGKEERPMDLQIASIQVWGSEELDHQVLNLKREPVQLAFGLAKGALIVERAAEVEAWLRTNL